MSKRHHAMHASQSHAIVKYINNMTNDQIESTYGIEFMPYGVIFDPTYNKTFESLGDWADWCISNDEMELKGIIQHLRYDALT